MRDISTFDSIANVGKIGKNIKNGHINATSTFTSASWLLMTRWITCVAHANDVFETCIAACSHILCPFSYLYISVQAEVAQPRTINNLGNSTGLQTKKKKKTLVTAHLTFSRLLLKPNALLDFPPGCGCYHWPERRSSLWHHSGLISTACPLCVFTTL